MQIAGFSLQKLVRGRSAKTLADQVLVSASNFLTGIILVRGLGLATFGKFTVAYVFLLLANSIQLSFISSPMITLGSLCATEEERHSLVRGVYGVQLIFCAVATFGTIVATIIYTFIESGEAPISLALPFAVAVAFYLMQDWLRRYYFTVGKATDSVWNDGISYVGQTVVLGALWAIHWLTIATAFWAIAITSGIAFVVGAGVERLSSSRSLTREAWRRIRTLSIDLGISNQLQWLVYQGAMLVGASVAGPQAAGGVRATQNVIGPVNIAFQAMENIVPIRAAEEMRRNGIRGASRFLFRFGAAGFVGLLIVFSAASLLSGRFLSFFYGHQLRVYAGVLNLQMLYFLLAWPIRQLTFLFRTVETTRPILISSIVAALLSMALVYPMVRGYGALGIVMAAVTGQIGNLVYLAIAWTRLSAVAERNAIAEAAEMKR